MLIKSFRVQATVLFGATAMALVLVLSISLFRLIGSHVARDQGDALHALAHHISVMLGEGMHERMREIELLSASPEMVGVSQAPQRATATLDRVQRTRQHYSWIGLASPQGTVQASTGSLLLGKDVSQRPWFKCAQQGSCVGDVHEAKLLAKFLPAPANGEPLRFVDFAAPVADANGKPLGVLGAHVNWQWVREVIEALHSDKARNNGVLVFIIDQKGHVIHRPDGPEGQIDPLNIQKLPTTSPGLVNWADGASYLTATAPLEAKDPRVNLGWTIIVRQPEALALDARDVAGRSILQIGAVAALLAMCLAWIMAGRLSRPLRNIATVATRIKEGDLSASLPAEQGSSELVTLSDSLREMTDTLVRSKHALEQANATLEARVQERTDALQRANEHLEVLARKDVLTALFNRRAAEDRMAEEAARHRRNGQVMSLLMLDIDHFKRINDQFGHDVGDEALKAVAQCLAQQCRSTDFVARFGGEEFLILLPETALPGAMQLAEKLRQAVAALQVPQVGQVTLSIGVACAEPAPPDAASHGSTVREVLKQADNALYLAKKTGRNRVASADMCDTVEATEPAAAI